MHDEIHLCDDQPNAVQARQSIETQTLEGYQSQDEQHGVSVIYSSDSTTHSGSIPSGPEPQVQDEAASFNFQYAGI